MKKGVYVIDHKIGNTDGGVDRKVMSQIRAFRENGLDFSLCEYDYVSDAPIWMKIAHRLPFTNVLPKWEYRKEFAEVDCIYIRKTFCGGAFISLLRQIRKTNHNVKIVMEIPSYPYDSELKRRLIDRPLLWKDMLTRSKYQLYVDRIAHLGEDKEIFGIPTLKFENGFDFDTYPVHKVREPDGVINLVCVAYFSPWHGYERLLNGLGAYYKKGGDRRIFIHFVGSGEELELYKSLVNRWQLDSNVMFYGRVDKETVRDVYDRCDIGMASLGAYKINYFVIGSY